MPTHPNARVAANWITHSVPVRTRDSTERLDHVYRRLLADTPAAAGPLDPADPSQTLPLPLSHQPG